MSIEAIFSGGGLRAGRPTVVLQIIYLTRKNRTADAVLSCIISLE